MKTTRKLTLAATAAGIIAISMVSPVWAQGPGGGRGQGQGQRGGMDPAQMFERSDANKDGKITKEEFQGPDFVFDRMDANSDGSITKEEAENMRRDRQRPEGGDAPEAREGGQGGFGAGGFDRSRFEQMMMDRYKEALESSDEEWKIVEPRIKKVLDAQRATRIGGGRGGMMGRSGRGGRGGPEGPGGEAAEEDGPAANLSKAIDTGSAEDIKSALKEYRQARKAKEAELKTAQTELRQVLTLKQEARLVMMGTLD